MFLKPWVVLLRMGVGLISRSEKCKQKTQMQKLAKFIA